MSFDKSLEIESTCPFRIAVEREGTTVRVLLREPQRIFDVVLDVALAEDLGRALLARKSGLVEHRRNRWTSHKKRPKTSR